MNYTEKSFLHRHLGVKDSEINEMLEPMSVNSIDELIKRVIPKNIYSPLNNDLLKSSLSEIEVLNKLQEYSNKNSVFKSFIGMGYYGTIVPNIIKRNIVCLHGVKQ